MTEYDYSPDAVERFQAKMAGVGKWANDQRYFAPKYANPFLPGENQATSPRSNTPPQPRPVERDRPQPSRSRTMPAPIATGTSPAPGHGHTSRAYAYAQQGGDARAPRPSSSKSRARSGSQPPDARYPYPTPVAPTPAAQQTRASPHAQPSPQDGRHVVYQNYAVTPGQPIMLPAPLPGQRYVIYPPKGGRVDVIDPRRPSSTSHNRSQSTTHSGSKASSPTKRNGDPFLKRLITTLTPNIEWDNPPRSRSTKRGESNRRRSTSR
ncbi:hypothetical protein C8Q80DRAFT_1137254 [Daedaleopsis nitida]|nr:hypothetical protein C8Q80DRAFT_1137254 [Daedaleopsis nitida]